MSESSRVVFVGCLHPTVTEPDLQELMSRAGAVEKVQIRRDEAGRSRCCGTVTFADAASAEKAILDFDDTRFRDRTLHVEAFTSRRPDAPKSEPTAIKMSESDFPEPPRHRHSHHRRHHHHGHHRHHRRRDDSGSYSGDDTAKKKTHHHHRHHHHGHHRHHHRRPAQYSSYSDEGSDRSRKGKD